MISQKMQDALNGQISAELYSAYLYLSMCAHFESIHLRGFAHWMRVQAQEELGHAMKLFDYVHEQGGKVALTALEAPPGQWDSPLAALEATLEHEKKITGLIHELVDKAAAEKDHATGVMLQWFVTEQVEEESSAGEVVEQLRMIGDSPNGLLMLDRALARRGG